MLVTVAYLKEEYRPEQIEDCLLAGIAHAREIESLNQVRVTYKDKELLEGLRRRNFMEGTEMSMPMLEDVVEYRLNEARMDAEFEWYTNIAYEVAVLTNQLSATFAQLRATSGNNANYKLPTNALRELEIAVEVARRYPWFPERGGGVSKME